MTSSTVALRISGVHLDPDEITHVLGVAPSFNYRNGDLISPGRSEAKRKCGMWLLKIDDAEPEDYLGQITALLSKLTDDLSVWEELAKKYQVDFYCGFFMDTTNQGFALPLKVIALLSERRIEIGFDVYSPSHEEEAACWAKQNSSSLGAPNEA